MGYIPWGRKELDTTERLSMHVLFGLQMRKGINTSSPNISSPRSLQTLSWQCRQAGGEASSGCTCSRLRSQETQRSSLRALRSCQLLLQQKCGGGILRAEMPPERSLHSPPPAPASCPSFPAARPLSPPSELQILVSTTSQTFPTPSQSPPETCPAPKPGQKPPAYSLQLGGPQAPSVLPPECSLHPLTTGLSLIACRRPP